jgi:predicted acylesterase/phospholipase RssA
VLASCSAPGASALVTISGRRYGDDGLHSPFNVDLRAGCDGVLLLIPLPNPQLQPVLDAEIAALGTAAVQVIAAHEASLGAIGRNPLSMDGLPPVLGAGATQARQQSGLLGSFWG